MRWAKLINGQIYYHSSKFPIYNGDGTITITSNTELLAANGFKPVKSVVPEPPEGYIATDFTWLENENEITQVWNYEEEVVVPYEETVEGRVETLELNDNMLIECILELSEVIYA